MEINLTDKYRLTSDGRCNFILQEKFEKRQGKGKHAPLSGEVGYRDVSYHGTLKGVANKMIDLEVKGSAVSNLESIVERIELLRDEIVAAVGKV